MFKKGFAFQNFQLFKDKRAKTQNAILAKMPTWNISLVSYDRGSSIFVDSLPCSCFNGTSICSYLLWPCVTQNTSPLWVRLSGPWGVMGGKCKLSPSFGDNEHTRQQHHGIFLTKMLSIFIHLSREYFVWSIYLKLAFMKVNSCKICSSVENQILTRKTFASEMFWPGLLQLILRLTNQTPQ